MSDPTTAHPLDPLAILKGLAALRKLAGTYPTGHPMIRQKLEEIAGLVAEPLRASSPLRIDVIRGDVFLDDVPSSASQTFSSSSAATSAPSAGISRTSVRNADFT